MKYKQKLDAITLTQWIDALRHHQPGCLEFVVHIKPYLSGHRSKSKKMKNGIRLK